MEESTHACRKSLVTTNGALWRILRWLYRSKLHRMPLSFQRLHKCFWMKCWRNVNSKGHSDEVSEMRNMSLPTGGTQTLVTRKQGLLDTAQYRELPSMPGSGFHLQYWKIKLKSGKDLVWTVSYPSVWQEIGLLSGKLDVCLMNYVNKSRSCSMASLDCI